MKPVYLTHYRRTAFSRAHPKKAGVDALADWPADALMAQLIDHSLETTGLGPEDIDELSLGCALAVKEQWSFGGRYPLMQSRLGDQASTRMIDQQCGSSLSALRFGMMTTGTGATDIVLAGGFEHMTRVPMGPALFKEGVLGVPAMPGTNGKTYDMTVALNMGLTAERLATEAGISRVEMDAFACRSHQRAQAAQLAGFFHDEILPIALTDAEPFSQDACIRPDTQPEALAQLPPAFSDTGEISAGNSSPLTSGASLGMLMSEAALGKTGATPLARVLGCVDRGTQPELMGQGVVPAVERLLMQHHLSVADIDLWEINEAFSVVPLYAQRKLGIADELLNIHGGALAIGHPLGATGVRLAGTLARSLHKTQGRYGIAAACIGGGQGIALLIERV
ncbi:acetyl-CoA C-acyltransferase [Saccharospirillum impatiens]|uniref:acetyl-CoA C-acyltransferase n=1 Tax=Saccharospirillum impatiens TaxID=169438 RepID=UPI000420E4E5|nr:acetyl-CoA C-acyltransferase [Saccharospirillum impatiens]